MNYTFKVPEKKRIRLIIHTDCANEVDDQFAVAHSLLTQKFIVRGIVAGHFDMSTRLPWSPYQPGATAKASYDEIIKVMKLMSLRECCPVLIGAKHALQKPEIPEISEGASFIVEEAMRDDDTPLFIGLQGALTDLASAILIQPDICSRMTAIWVGGGNYPAGGFEFNLTQDVYAANVVFASKMQLWQIPLKVYKTLSVSLAELQYKVKPCGTIGNYLFENLVRFNEALGDGKYSWPHGELWGLGDQGIIAVLMQENERVDNYTLQKAPMVNPRDMSYSFDNDNRVIRVYHSIDYRLTLEDLFAKLAINYR